MLASCTRLLKQKVMRFIARSRPNVFRASGAAEPGSTGAPGGGLELPTEGGTEGSVGQRGGLAGLPTTRV
jgi:hypothetical protein